MKKQKDLQISGKTIALLFDRYEEQEELKTALNGGNYHAALFEIANEIFRPHRKHGYANSDLQKLTESEEVLEAIGILEHLFYQILKERNIEL